MDQVSTLRFALSELHRQVAGLDGADMGTLTNCAPWTVRRLASHALNNQLLWAGVVTGEHPVSPEGTMGAIAYEGNLITYADEVVDRTLDMWARPGILSAIHVTPLGELPGSVVINFPTIDALCHAWDLAASLGRPLEFPPNWIPVVAAVVEITCDDTARSLGLIKDVAIVPSDANETDRLMALAGRARPQFGNPTLTV